MTKIEPPKTAAQINLAAGVTPTTFIPNQPVLASKPSTPSSPAPDFSKGWSVAQMRCPIKDMIKALENESETFANIPSAAKAFYLAIARLQKSPHVRFDTHVQVVGDRVIGSFDLGPL